SSLNYTLSLHDALPILGKIQTLLRVDVDLVDALKVDFHRIFRRGNVPLHGVEDVEAGIQGHRLTRAGRSGNQNHALRLVQGLQRSEEHTSELQSRENLV